ncbi:hypothetical protein BN194_15280 [Lacticaseibacillus paracasei]|nr:hypothetical protein BN194_15280 [Lacticaseibacillus paracasei]
MQGLHRFTHTTSFQNNRFFWGKRFEFLGFSKDVLIRQLDVVHANRSFDYFFNISAGQNDASSERSGRINNLLNALNVAGNTGNNDPAILILECFFNVIINFMFISIWIRRFRIGRIRKQGQYLFIPNLCQARPISLIHRCGTGVKFEITGINNLTFAGFNIDPQRSGNTMCCPKEGDRHIAKINDRLLINHMKVFELFSLSIMLHEYLGHRDRQFRAKNWHRMFHQKIW